MVTTILRQPTSSETALGRISIMAIHGKPANFTNKYSPSESESMVRIIRSQLKRWARSLIRLIKKATTFTRGSFRSRRSKFTKTQWGRRASMQPKAWMLSRRIMQQPGSMIKRESFMRKPSPSSKPYWAHSTPPRLTRFSNCHRRSI